MDVEIASLPEESIQSYSLALLVPPSFPDSKHRLGTVDLLGDGSLLASYEDTGCLRFVHPGLATEHVMMNPTSVLSKALSFPHSVFIFARDKSGDIRREGHDLIYFNSSLQKKDRYSFIESTPLALFCDDVNTIIIGSNGEFFRKKLGPNFGSKPPLVRVASGEGILKNIDEKLSKLMGNRLLIVSEGAFQLWDLLTGTTIISKDEEPRITAGDLTQTHLVVASAALHIWILGKSKGEEKLVTVSINSPVTAVNIQPTFIVTGNKNSAVTSYNVSTGDVISSVKVNRVGEEQIASPDDSSEDSKSVGKRGDAPSSSLPRRVPSSRSLNSQNSSPSMPALSSSGSFDDPNRESLTPPLSSVKSSVLKGSNAGKSPKHARTRSAAARSGKPEKLPKVTSLLVVKEFLFAGDKSGQVSALALKSTEGHIDSSIVEQRLLSHRIEDIKLVGDAIVILSRAKSKNEGQYVHWRPVLRVNSKPTLHILKVLMPNGHTSSIASQPAIVLRNVLDGILRKKPELNSDAMGHPVDANGTVINPYTGEFCTIIYWGTTKQQWQLEGHVKTIQEFIKNENKQVGSDKFLRLYLPRGQKSSQVFVSDRTVKEVLEKLYSTRPELRQGNMSVTDLHGQRLLPEMKIGLVEGQGIAIGTDIISWMKDYELNQEKRSEFSVSSSPKTARLVHRRVNSSAEPNKPGRNFMNMSAESSPRSSEESTMSEGDFSERSRPKKKPMRRKLSAEAIRRKEILSASENEHSFKSRGVRSNSFSSALDRYAVVKRSPSDLSAGSTPSAPAIMAQGVLEAPDGPMKALEELPWVDVLLPLTVAESVYKPVAPLAPGDDSRSTSPVREGSPPSTPKTEMQTRVVPVDGPASPDRSPSPKRLRSSPRSVPVVVSAPRAGLRRNKSNEQNMSDGASENGTTPKVARSPLEADTKWWSEVGRLKHDAVLNQEMTLFCEQLVFGSGYHTHLSHVWASYGADSVDTGPLIVCRRDKDYSAITFSKYGVNVMTPGKELTFRDSKKWLTWLCESLFRTTVKALDLHHVSYKEAFADGLASIERDFVPVKHKIGVLNVLKDQTEKTIYANSEISADFQAFLDILGTKTALLDFAGYSGGLDVTSRAINGMHTIVRPMPNSRSQGVMFHVSAMIPGGQNDPTRKRHIGNDVVVVFFNESGQRFNPTHVMRSKFTHVYVVVEKVKNEAEQVQYRVEVFVRDGVALVAPYLPEDPVFIKGEAFEKWLITKLINLETAAICYAPDFTKMRSRAREGILLDLVSRSGIAKSAKKLRKSLSQTTVNSEGARQGPRVTFVAQEDRARSTSMRNVSKGDTISRGDASVVARVSLSTPILDTKDKSPANAPLTQSLPIPHTDEAPSVAPPAPLSRSVDEATDNLEDDAFLEGIVPRRRQSVDSVAPFFALLGGIKKLPASDMASQQSSRSEQYSGRSGASDSPHILSSRSDVASDDEGDDAREEEPLSDKGEPVTDKEPDPQVAVAVGEAAKEVAVAADDVTKA